jgi:NADPH2:quinone reductase
MHRYGPPAVLRLEDVALLPLRPGEIRLRAIASAINHSDLEIRAGNWPIRGTTPFPYVPGLEVVGEVMETGAGVADFKPGDRAITMMQGLGGVRAERPGGYAQHVTVAADAAAPVSADLDPLDVAALGLAAVTAHEGLRKIGDLAGKRVAITGAAGGVGSAAVAIARAMGADAVATVSRAAQADYARGLGASRVFTPEEVASGALGEASLDGILDSVAGPGFPAFVTALRPGGTLSAVGAVGGNAVALDAYRLLAITLTGYSSETLDGPSLRRAMAAISGWLRAGKLKPPARRLFALKDAARAHELLEGHGVTGRVLLVPGPQGNRI